MDFYGFPLLVLKGLNFSTGDMFSFCPGGGKANGGLWLADSDISFWVGGHQLLRVWGSEAGYLPRVAMEFARPRLEEDGFAAVSTFLQIHRETASCKFVFRGKRGKGVQFPGDSHLAVAQKTGIPQWVPGKWKHGLQNLRFA